VAVFFIALKKAPNKVILCLIIPFYVYVFAKNEPKAKPFLWALYAGIVLLIVGVISVN
jgi:Flp pilus assembly protein protease CpaA